MLILAVKIYILSVLLNLVMKIINDYIFFINITNQGYKFECYKKIQKKNVIHLLVCFIPLINFILRIKEIINLIFFNNYLYFLLKERIIIPLTEEELFHYYYNKKKFISILKINFDNKIYPTCIIIYNENNLENTIYYTILENQIVITSTKGPISKLKRKKQYDILEKQLNETNIIHSRLISNQANFTIQKQLLKKFTMKTVN